MKTHVKALVVGGGAVGNGIAYHLAKAGWDTMLVERDELTAGSTWHAAGGFHTLNGDPNVAKLQQYTINLYKEIEEISGVSCGVHITGGLMLACTRTRFDWLSRDPDEVDKYVNDPLCGFRCTNQLWLDLLQGLQQITPRGSLLQIDSNLPLLVIGGECDPVSEGKRLKDLASALCSAGANNLQVKIYPNARHELFNEINRDEVTADVIHWLNQALNASRNCPTSKETP